MARESFAERLKKAMNERGIKQVDLIRYAQEQGVKLGKSHISQYVSGKTVPRADMVHFLAGALQVDPTGLMESLPNRRRKEKQICENLKNHLN